MSMFTRGLQGGAGKDGGGITKDVLCTRNHLPSPCTSRPSSSLALGASNGKMGVRTCCVLCHRKMSSLFGGNSLVTSPSPPRRPSARPSLVTSPCVSRPCHDVGLRGEARQGGYGPITHTPRELNQNCTLFPTTLFLPPPPPPASIYAHRGVYFASSENHRW